MIIVSYRWVAENFLANLTLWQSLLEEAMMARRVKKKEFYSVYKHLFLIHVIFFQVFTIQRNTVALLSLQWRGFSLFDNREFNFMKRLFTVKRIDLKVPLGCLEGSETTTPSKLCGDSPSTTVTLLTPEFLKGNRAIPSMLSSTQ